tara:strand:+ start:16467 stop:17627 length:1161 start_codon:yes stop_codon:yes gene_type:complete
MIRLQRPRWFGDSKRDLNRATEIRRIRLLISDTGGGHRACATALRDALLEAGPDLHVDIVDGLRETGRFPIHRMPELYTRWSEKRNLWRTTFYLTNGRRLSNTLIYPWQRFSKHALRRSIVEGDPDLVVVLHPCLTYATYKTVQGMVNRPQIATVVTDLVYGHASWFAHGADRYFVPTEAMMNRALKQKIPREKIQLTGLPLASRLFELRARRNQLRNELGFERPSVICVGGADGMGIQRIAPALAKVSKGIDVHLVCGKNEALKRKLEAQKFGDNIHLHGFVSNLPEMLAASDMALIKASPTVLMEALTVGAYVLLYDFVPGQEYPNVRFVQEHGLGDFSRSPKAIVTKINEHFERLAHLPFEERAVNFVPQDGARTIAQELLRG